MKVRLIKRQTIEDYISRNAQSKAGFATWIAISKRANWKVPGDIVETYSSADIPGNGTDRVVFNIGGNKYRIICKYLFGKAYVHLFVVWVGAHAEYTKLCNKGEQYKASLY